MSYSNGVISAPVSVTDVKSVLGVTSNDVGTLCKSDRINKWAKYKPFINASLTFADDAARDNAQRLAHYGLAAPDATGGANIDNVMSKSWVYSERTAPFRLGDYIHYNHNAKCPITLNNAEYNLFHHPTVTFVTRNIIGNYNLAFGDVFDTNTYDNVHLCLLLRGYNASNIYIRKLIISYYKNPSTGAETGTRWSYLDTFGTDIINSFKGDIEVTLLATNQPLASASDVNKLVDVSGSYSFYPVPYNALSDVQCTIKQNNVFGFTTSLNGLQNYGSRTSSWTSADRYNPWAQQQSGTLKQYWRLRNSAGSICYSTIMRFAMTNNTDSAITLYRDKFSASLERTFSSTSATAKSNLSAMLNDSGQSVSEITIGAHQTVNVGFELADGIYRGTQSSPSNQTLSITVYFYYATSGNAVFSQPLNVQNY